MGHSPFARQLTFEPGYRVDVDAMWNCPLVPHGGLVTAIAAQAMADELADPTQHLRSITTVFAGPVQPGPSVADVLVLRRGRSISQVQATLRNEGADAGLTAMAVFGTDRPGFSFTDLTPPQAEPPDRYPSFREAPPGPFHFNFWDHVDGRVVQGHTRGTDFPPSDSSERIYWYRFDEPPLLDGGVLDPLALVTLCDTMPGAVAQRVGSDTPVWLPPSADLTVHVLDECRSEWVLGRNHCRWAGDGYASLDMELWSPDGRLCAYGTQVAFFVFPEGSSGLAPAPQ